MGSYLHHTAVTRTVYRPSQCIPRSSNMLEIFGTVWMDAIWNHLSWPPVHGALENNFFSGERSGALGNPYTVYGCPTWWKDTEPVFTHSLDNSLRWTLVENLSTVGENQILFPIGLEFCFVYRADCKKSFMYGQCSNQSFLVVFAHNRSKIIAKISLYL